MKMPRMPTRPRPPVPEIMSELFAEVDRIVAKIDRQRAEIDSYFGNEASDDIVRLTKLTEDMETLLARRYRELKLLRAELEGGS
jgi:hypothetical protein